MKKATKHKNTIPLPIKLTDGIDLRTSALAIADSASPVMQNWYYPKGAVTPEVRPAVTCETGTSLGTDIKYLFHYTKDASNSWIMGVSDAFDVYYFNTSTKLWVDTGIDVGQKPSMCTFNSILYIAHGATTLITWNGSSAGTQSINGTIEPTVVTEINNRLVVNDSSTTGLDLVCFSAPEDATEWTFTSVGGAVSLRAGYKDGSKVVGLIKNFKNELIVFKQGERSESIYRVQTLGAPYVDADSQWVAEFVIDGQGCSNGFCVDSVDTAVLFLGRYGFSALVADEMYSELNMSSIGDKVNPVLGAVGNTNIGIKYLATSGQVWILRSTTEVYVYHPHNSAFTIYSFNEEQINAVIETTDGIYCAGESGHLYKLDAGEYQDEFASGVNSDLVATLKTKDIDFGPGRGLIKFSEILFSPELQNTNEIFYLDNTKNSQVSVDTHSDTGTGLDDFMTATLDFMGASEYDFMGIDGYPWTQEIRNKFKGKRCQLQINTTGRCGLSEITIHVAMVG